MRYILALMVLAGFCYGALSGDGSEGDPWQIGSAADWQEFVDGLQSTATLRDDFYIITADINFGGAAIEPASAAATKLTGTLDGDNHTLSNFVVSTGSSVNEYALVYNNGGIIKDIIVTNATVTGTSTANDNSYHAIIVGQNGYGATVSNCHVSGTVTSTHTQAGSTYGLTGGIAGANHGTVTGCSSSATITASATAGLHISVGGLIGYQTGGVSAGQIGSCASSYSTGSVTVTESATSTNIGGCIGRSVVAGDTQTITSCYSTGAVSFTSTDTDSVYTVGGFIGSNCATITNCYAKCSLYASTAAITASSGRLYCGGFIGQQTTGGTSIASYSDVDLRIACNGNYGAIGGFVGRVNTDITDCYAIGSLYDAKAGTTALTFPTACGGFTATAYGGTITRCWCAIDPYSDNGEIFGFSALGGTTFADCFFDAELSTVTQVGVSGVTAKTTEEMKTVGTFTNFDFAGDGQVWKMLGTYAADSGSDLKSSYPYLLWQTYPYSGGLGTSASPYRIRTTRDWNWAYGNIDVRTEATTYFSLERDSTLATELMILKKGGSGNSGAIYPSGLYKTR